MNDRSTDTKTTKTVPECFVDRLLSLGGRASNGDPEARASLARLRRGLGREPGTVLEALEEVLPYLPMERDVSGDEYRREREICLLLGALFAFHPSHSSEHRNLGATMRAAGEQSPSAVQRFVQLLSARRPQLPHLLRQAVAIAAAADVPIDYYQLARDLVHWDDEGRRVQLDWARQFWPPQTPPPSGEDVHSQEEART